MIKESRKQVNEMKSENRKKRRERDEQCVKQKKIKIDNLKNKMLPDDLLDQISESVPSNDLDTLQKVPTKIEFESDDDDDDDDDLSDKSDLSDCDDVSSDLDDNYLSLDAKGGIKSVPLAEAARPLLDRGKEIASFKREQLYSKHISRVSTKTLLNNRIKKKARHF